MRDLDVAEELAQDALVAALEQWPADGVPRNPGTWLMTIAKRAARSTGSGATRTAIAHLYAALAALTSSPVVEPNRAVTVGMAEGPEAGLAVLDAVAEAPALRDYHLPPSVRGDLLARLSRNAEARAEFERAAALARNEAERALLLDRAAGLGGQGRGPEGGPTTEG